MEDNKFLLWVRGQIKAARVPQIEGHLVEHLLSALQEFDEKQHPVDKEALELALDVFSKLAQGQPLVADVQEGVWVQARPGQLVVGDTVRVRVDAYKGAAGLTHNGRVGRITATRYGDVHVRYENDQDSKHSPHSLEKRVS